MKFLSQRDPVWSTKTLGMSKLTIGRYGCTTCCISMLTDYFGAWASPVSIASHKDWYTADGLILWNKLALSAMSFEKREYGWNDFAICQAMSDPDRAVILNVNDGQHWVVALRKTIFSNDYVVLDPWTGKKALAFKDYHNINGAAYFKRNKL